MRSDLSATCAIPDYDCAALRSQAVSIAALADALADARLQPPQESLVRSIRVSAAALLASLQPPAPDTWPHVTPSADSASSEAPLVLLAHGDPLLRQALRMQLAAFGVAADCAPDGRQALARWRSGRHVMLLTDTRLPVLDAGDLTARIRAEEPAGTRRPIIGLSLETHPGEADRCLAVGMDDCRPSPLTQDEVAALLQRWLPRRASDIAPLSTIDQPTRRQPPVLDADALARLVGHDPSLLAAIRSDFASAARATASELERAVAGGDWHAASAVAHRLNGSSQSVGAMQLAYLCARIEAAGRRGAGAEVVAAQAQFGDAVQAVLDRLAGTDADHAAAPDILLVDDDPLQLRLIRQQLLHLGLTGIQTAGSGADALALLRNRDSSRLLLLLDLNMDGMDGIELMRELADTGFAGALALVSAADERVLESGARLAGEHRLNLVGHLHKPVLPQTLGALIGRWRDSGAAAPRPARRPEKQYTAVDLQRALAQRQFFLVFQPKVCLADDRLDGVEALVRWQHPIDGVVFPDHFIELAEDAGLIDALTDQVLELAVRQAAQWGADGPVPNIAINVSMENLVRLDFPERVLGLLARHGVEPKRLQIEVTESRLLADARAPLDILTRLRMHHVELAIDDFGIGHSSLAQLRDLPFSELKIDRSFVHGCREHPTQRAIVAASTEMARRLGMRTVAEGIGDADDLEAARDAGCDIAQGFYIGAPMSAEGLERWIRGRDNRRPPASTFSTRREHQRRPATAAPIR